MTWVALLLSVALATVARAHVLDAYVQGTIVELEPGDIQLRMNLTPGVEIADQVIGLIDRDGDGVISAGEGAAYVKALRRDLVATVDGRVVGLEDKPAVIPSPAELRTGLGIIQIEFVVISGPLKAGTHRFVLENRHYPSKGEYLFNAGKPRSERVRIVAQKRNENQSRGEIEFTYSPAPGRTAGGGRVGMWVGVIVVVVGAGVWGMKNRRVRQGVRGARGIGREDRD